MGEPVVYADTLITAYPVRYTPEEWRRLKRAARIRALTGKAKR